MRRSGPAGENQLHKKRMAGIIEKKMYFALNLPVSGFDTDRLSATLHQKGCLGILESSAAEWTVYLPGDWTPEHFHQLFLELRRINMQFLPDAVHLEKLPFRDWNAEWRKYFQPAPLGKGLWVRPPWQPLPAGIIAQEIIIDPQMAFGTGHHETTRLMVAAMETLELRDLSVLDLGTGSGILAIAARKMGAHAVIGIDIDPDAIANAEHNLQLNRERGVEFIVGNISCVTGRVFPVILANIQFHILAPIADALYQTLAPAGRLVVSGILATDAEAFIQCYRRVGFRLLEQQEMGEWAAMIFTK